MKRLVPISLALPTCACADLFRVMAAFSGGCIWQHSSQVTSKTTFKSCVALVLLLATGILPPHVAVAAVTEPWPSQYLIKPWETDRLTAADVIGPDGIVYPDWRRAGVTGGIPDLSNPAVRAAYKEFAVPIGASDSVLSATLVQAVEHAKGGGKSLVQLAAGTYSISSSLPAITANHVVISGAGMDKTILELVPGDKGGALFQTGGKSPWSGPTVVISGKVPRGSTLLEVPTTKGFAVNDVVWLGTVVPNELTADSTMRKRYDWPASKTFYSNQYNGHFGRGMLARVAVLTTNAITLDRAVSHDLYADEPVQLRRVALVSGVGIQDLTTTTADASVTRDPFLWQNITDCWLLRVAVRKAPNWPLGHGSNYRLNCEVRDCVFDGSSANINGGGLAYLGWSGVMVDCLMVNCRGNDLRHMAIFQGAIRCVVRDCVFTGATVRSPQFHGQLPHDNLIEGTTFDLKSHVWTVDGAASLRHGVEGPRNVLYHCRFPFSAGTAEFMGAVEAHILAYNRWSLGENPVWRESPVLAFDRTWNTVVRGNVIQADPRFPLINLNDTSCIGWEVRGNTVYGSNGILSQGDGQVAIHDANRRLTLGETMIEPKPEATSIVDWQGANADKPRLVLVPIETSILSPEAKTTLRVTRVKASAANPLSVRLSASSAGAVMLSGAVIIPAGSVFADFEVQHGGGRGEVTLRAEAEGLLSDLERLTLLDSALNSAAWLQPDGDHVAPGLPDGWELIDFGRAATATTAIWNEGHVSLKGGGVAFGEDRNIRPQERSQLWQTLEGDGSIVARLTTVSSSAQTGLIIADDAAPTTEFICVLADGTVIATGTDNQYTAKPKSVRKGDGGKPPVWLRLSRKGGVFTAVRSSAANPSETDWQELAKVDFYADPPENEKHYRSQAKLDSRMHFGILLNTNEAGTPAEATYQQVTVTPVTPP
jgi:hypothetical protein